MPFSFKSVYKYNLHPHVMQYFLYRKIYFAFLWYNASRKNRYYDFIGLLIVKLRAYVKDGSSLFDAVRKVIRHFESHELIADYFQKHESEVFDMVNFEWNADRAKEVAFNEGAQQVIVQVAISLLKNKAPMNLITDATHLSAEEVEKIAREHQLAV